MGITDFVVVQRNLHPGILFADRRRGIRAGGNRLLRNKRDKIKPGGQQEYKAGGEKTQEEPMVSDGVWGHGSEGPSKSFLQGFNRPLDEGWATVGAVIGVLALIELL